ncbi:dihydrolipoyl dehydrogenase family protein [Chloroflexota bacterium]
MATTYDLAIIGMGAAGLTGAPFATALGARVAVIEKDRIGGDCTWTGCVPSKTLIRAARLVHQARTADSYGLDRFELQVRYQGLLDHINGVVDDIYQPTSPESLRRKGLEVFLGEPRFLDAHTISVDGTLISARKTIVCTGAAPSIPPISGLDGVDYLTYLSVWSLHDLPRHLVVLGAGPIGRELAQGYRRLGAEVTLVEAKDTIADDPDVAQVVRTAFENEGIDVRTSATVERVWQDGQGIHLATGSDEVVGDALLVATGRRPNVDGLDMERAGVEYDRKGIHVNSRLRTSHHDVYAAGDCTGGLQFSHYAGWQGFMATRNALLPVSTAGTSEYVPWCIFTDPEVAHVGLTEAAARRKHGDDVVTYQWPMTKVDRARNEGEVAGFLKLVYRKNGRILGATAVASQAGEMINEWVVALREGFKIDGLARSIHTYPTYSTATLQATAAISVERALSGLSGRLIRRVARVKRQG